MASTVASMMTLRQSWRTVQQAAGISTVSCLAEVLAAAVWQGQRRIGVQAVRYRLPSMFHHAHQSFCNTFHLSRPSGMAVTTVLYSRCLVFLSCKMDNAVVPRIINKRHAVS